MMVNMMVVMAMNHWASFGLGRNCFGAICSRFGVSSSLLNLTGGCLRGSCRLLRAIRSTLSPRRCSVGLAGRVSRPLGRIRPRRTTRYQGKC
jgi:hypothetical protein